MSPLKVPDASLSSKRSRSRDSSRSAGASSLRSTASTPLQPPFQPTPSLIIPPPQTDGTSGQDPAPYPAFLRSTKPEVRGKFQNLEWEQLNRIREGVQQQNTPEQTSPWTRCSGNEVFLRNRYANVDPYEVNRVKLQVPEGHCDYINASPIVLESTKSKTVTRYIATQGPKSDSMSHIWRMIWHECTSPAVIIMLTQTHESGREKCYPYYPQFPDRPEMKVNAQDEFADGFSHTLKLVSLSESEEARAQIREIDMIRASPTAGSFSEQAAEEKEKENMKVWHLLFGGWPDFSAPEGDSREALLRLIEISREKNADNSSNPRIVHCSAGVGRSGSFIALDWLLQELSDGSLDDVPPHVDPILSVVDQLRRQRMMMVQSEVQYMFLYDVIKERWRERWIRLHSQEAERLGLGLGMGSGIGSGSAMSAKGEPRHKKAKQSQSQESGSEGSAESVSRESQSSSEPDSSAGDEDEHAQTEAELMDAEGAAEAGKT